MDWISHVDENGHDLGDEEITIEREIDFELKFMAIECHHEGQGYVILSTYSEDSFDGFIQPQHCAIAAANYCGGESFIPMLKYHRKSWLLDENDDNRFCLVLR